MVDAPHRQSGSTPDALKTLNERLLLATRAGQSNGVARSASGPHVRNARGVIRHVARRHPGLAERTRISVGPSGTIEIVISVPGRPGDIEISADCAPGPYFVLTSDGHGHVTEYEREDLNATAALLDQLIG